MDTLVERLKAIENCEDIAENEILNWGYLNERHNLIQEAVQLADEVLLTPDGQRNFENEIFLCNNGFYVSCLEHDGFGWLAGGIETCKGIISYG